MCYVILFTLQLEIDKFLIILVKNYFRMKTYGSKSKRKNIEKSLPLIVSHILILLFEFDN